MLHSLPLPKTTVLKCSPDQAPFHVFREWIGGQLWKSLVGRWQAVGWSWSEGAPDSWGPGKVSPSGAGGFFPHSAGVCLTWQPLSWSSHRCEHRGANSNAYKTPNLPSSRRSLTVPQAWCPAVKQRKTGEDHELRRGKQKLWLPKSVFGLTAPNLHHPKGELIISRWTSGSSIRHLWNFSSKRKHSISSQPD